MEKRGLAVKAQVSMFIIFAIILIATAGVSYYFYINSSKSDDDYFNSPEIKPRVENIISSIKNCMKNDAEDTIYLIGMQGGYISPPKHYFDLGWGFMPYYYIEGDFFIPETSEIESEISRFYNPFLYECLNEIDGGDIDLSVEYPKTKTTISENNVKFFVDSSIVLKKDSRRIKYELKDFPLDYSSSFYEMYDISKNILDYYKKEPAMICLDCITEIAKNKGLYVLFTDFEDNVRSVAIFDNSSIDPFTFEFLIKHKDKGEPIERSAGVIPNAV